MALARAGCVLRRGAPHAGRWRRGRWPPAPTCRGARSASDAAEVAQLPPHLQRIVEDYDAKRAEEARSWQGRLAESRTAGIVGVGLGGALLYLLYCLDDASSDVHLALGHLLRSLDPETARDLLMRAARRNRLPKDYDKDDPFAVLEAQDLRFVNPVGLGPGVDRGAEAPNAFVNLGFGFVEVGPVGVEDAGAVRQRLAWRHAWRDNLDLSRLGVVGVALAGDRRQLVALARGLGPHADYLAVDLAALPAGAREGEEQLRELLAELVGVAAALPAGPKVLLRLPVGGSGSRAQRATAAGAAARAALAAGAAGVVLAGEEDYSGSNAPPLEDLSATVSEVYRQTGASLLIVASGAAVVGGGDALDLLEAGATLVQISPLLLREGPGACRRVKTELSQVLMMRGYVRLQDAVGAAHRRQRGPHTGKRKNLWKAKPAAQQ